VTREYLEGDIPAFSFVESQGGLSIGVDSTIARRRARPASGAAGC
jgi:hypothetical protein